MPDSLPAKVRPTLRLLGYARPYAWLVLIVIVFSLLYGGGVTGRAFIVRNLVDDVALKNARVESISDVLKRPRIEAIDPHKLRQQRRDLKKSVRKNLWRVALSGLLLVVLMPLIRLVRDYASEWVMTRVLVDMQRELAEKLLRLPLGRHQRETRGDAIARLTSDTAIANRLQSQIFGDVLEDAGVVRSRSCWRYSARASARRAVAARSRSAR